MLFCPECSAEINELIEVSSQIYRVCVIYHQNEIGEGWLESTGQSEIDWNADGEVIHYVCGKCDEAIFFNYQDAVDFLRSNQSEVTDVDSKV